MVSRNPKTIRVKPLPESARTKKKKWQVQVSGARVSTHGTKKEALRRAKTRHMRTIDTVKVHRTNGTKQREFSGKNA